MLRVRGEQMMKRDKTKNKKLKMRIKRKEIGKEKKNLGIKKHLKN